MEIGTLTGRRYRVALERDRVQRMDLGPGPLGSRVRCTVPLTGSVDEHWRACFRAVQVDDTGFFRYRLELTSDVVTFTRTVTGTGSEVDSELKSLEFLIEAVNARASSHGKTG
ncbi:MAG: hypothetical protein M3167_05330 [Acidobacteriota bacterium]|nr:hypothetical protein [Acidobacteriota bacterium]